jgi:hypothetical protein
MTLEYPPQPDSPSPLFVTTRSYIMSAMAPQLRFQVRGMNGSYLKNYVDPQEAKLKKGIQAGDKSIGEEDEGESGVMWRVKEIGKVDLVKET